MTESNITPQAQEGQAEPATIDWTKPVRTKGTQTPVRIIAVDDELNMPVIGVLEGDAEVNTWSLDGGFHTSGEPSTLDLEQSPEPKPDRLTQALVGLCVLALGADDLNRLVAQFLKTNPEIRMEAAQ